MLHTPEDLSLFVLRPTDLRNALQEAWRQTTGGHRVSHTPLSRNREELPGTAIRRWSTTARPTRLGKASRSRCGVGAVDYNVTARHVGRVVGGEEHRCRRNLLRTGPPPEGERLGGRGARNVAVGISGVSVSPGQGVDANAVGSQFERSRASHSAHDPLGRNVGEVVGERDQPRRGANVDDRTAPFLAHWVDDRLHSEEGTYLIDVDQFSVVRLGGAVHTIGPEDTRIVGQDGRDAESRLAFGDDACPVDRGRDVTL